MVSGLVLLSASLLPSLSSSSSPSLALRSVQPGQAMVSVPVCCGVLPGAAVNMTINVVIVIIIIIVNPQCVQSRPAMVSVPVCCGVQPGAAVSVTINVVAGLAH